MSKRAWCVLCQKWLPVEAFEPLELKCRNHVPEGEDEPQGDPDDDIDDDEPDDDFPLMSWKNWKGFGKPFKLDAFMGALQWSWN